MKNLRESCIEVQGLYPISSVNRTRQEVSQISLPFNFGLPHAKSLERYDSDELATMFRYVTQHNADWTVGDALVAEGDYREVVQFDQAQVIGQTFSSFQSSWG